MIAVASLNAARSSAAIDWTDGRDRRRPPSAADSKPHQASTAAGADQTSAGGRGLGAGLDFGALLHLNAAAFRNVTVILDASHAAIRREP